MSDPRSEADTRDQLLLATQGGVRLDRFLAERLAISRAQARRLLDQGKVRLDGSRVAARDKGRALAAGARVEVEAFRAPQDQVIVPEPLQAGRGPVAAVLARGEGWLAIDKRAGFPVHPLKEFETGTVLNVVASMHAEVQGIGEGGLRSGVVHRLDVETSGVLLVATTAASWARLRRAFREHRVEKVYRAIVAGNLLEPVAQQVGLRVAQHQPARVRVTEPSQAARDSSIRRAVQHVQPLEQFQGACLVEVRPRTGFLHQIRATLADLGHPVIGDSTYGAGARTHGAARHQLHAARVRFEEVEAASPDPEDFASLLTRLRSAGIS